MRFGLVTDFITGQLRLIRTLRGLTPKFGSFNDAEFDESQATYLLLTGVIDLHTALGFVDKPFNG